MCIGDFVKQFAAQCQVRPLLLFLNCLFGGGDISELAKPGGERSALPVFSFHSAKSTSGQALLSAFLSPPKCCRIDRAPRYFLVRHIIIKQFVGIGKENLHAFSMPFLMKGDTSCRVSWDRILLTQHSRQRIVCSWLRWPSNVDQPFDLKSKKRLNNE